MSEKAPENIQLILSDTWKVWAQTDMLDSGTAYIRADKVEALKEFARTMIMDYCWDLHEPDGGDIQEIAEKLGFIESHKATAEDVNDEFSCFDVGDIIFKFTAALTESETKK